MTTRLPPGAVHIIVPDAVDDPARPSGGNRYDRRVSTGLAAAGWRVHEHQVPDAWPRLGDAGVRETARVVAALPDGAVVLADGLIACAAQRVFVPAAARIRLFPLVHMPLGNDAAARTAEADVLIAARSVIATSNWTRDWLVTTYRLDADAVHVAEPGVDPAPPVTSSPSGTRLLSVGPLAPHKGQDLLVGALTRLSNERWCCRCIGTLDDADPFVRRLRATIARAGLADRLRLLGSLAGAELNDAYGSADVLVHPARAETYGMVVTEALARGVPVIAAACGGVPDAVGRAPGGARPGMLVAPDDLDALAAALRAWLTDAALRRRLRHAALQRRTMLPTWTRTTEQVAQALAGVGA